MDSRRDTRRIVWLVALFWTAPAQATPATTRAVWQSAGACMDADELQEGVERRLGRRVFSAVADLVLRGNVSFQDGKAHAELELRTADTRLGRRGTLVGSRDLDMDGEDCRVLDESLLLVTSIMIDVPREELPPPPPPEAPPVSAEKPRAVPPLGTPLRLPPRSEVKVPAPARSWAYGVFLDGASSVGALPLGSVGADLGLRLEPRGFWPIEFSGVYDHAFASADAGELHIDSLMWGLGLCPFDFGLELCVGQRVGAVWARGAGLENNRSRRRIRGEITVGLRWSPSLGSHHLVLGLEGLVPLVQDRYLYQRGDEQVELFQVAPVGARLSLGFRLGL
ncbi:MAG: hypothetical protein KC766_36320 [Myxococcales bacterium]|nr:hypothetical protein [Myxococcales bacterium]